MLTEEWKPNGRILYMKGLQSISSCYNQIRILALDDLPPAANNAANEFRRHKFLTHQRAIDSGWR